MPRHRLSVTWCCTRCCLEVFPSVNGSTYRSDAMIHLTNVVLFLVSYGIGILVYLEMSAGTKISWTSGKNGGNCYCVYCIPHCLQFWTFAPQLAAFETVFFWQMPQKKQKIQVGDWLQRLSGSTKAQRELRWEEGRQVGFALRLQKPTDTVSMVDRDDGDRCQLL